MSLVYNWYTFLFSQTCLILEAHWESSQSIGLKHGARTEHSQMQCRDRDNSQKARVAWQLAHRTSASRVVMHASSKGHQHGNIRLLSSCQLASNGKRIEDINKTMQNLWMQRTTRAFFHSAQSKLGPVLLTTMVRHDFHPVQGTTFFAKCIKMFQCIPLLRALHVPERSWEPSSAKCDSATWDDILINL